MSKQQGVYVPVYSFAWGCGDREPVVWYGPYKDTATVRRYFKQQLQEWKEENTPLEDRYFIGQPRGAYRSRNDQRRREANTLEPPFAETIQGVLQDLNEYLLWLYPSWEAVKAGRTSVQEAA